MVVELVPLKGGIGSIVFPPIGLYLWEPETTIGPQGPLEDTKRKFHQQFMFGNFFRIVGVWGSKIIDWKL